MKRAVYFLFVVRILILSLMLMNDYSGGVQAANWKQRFIIKKELPGRQVRFRVYPDWNHERTNFQWLSVVLEGKELNVNIGQLDEGSTLVLFGTDQEDELVREYLGIGGYAWSYEEGLSFPFPDGMGNYTIISDANKDPIPLATVKICSIKDAMNFQKFNAFQEYVTDEMGRVEIEVPAAFVTSRRSIVVWHPAYDGCRIIHGLPGKSQSNIGNLMVSLTKKGSIFVDRAFRGYVMDDANQPISGALVKVCRRIDEKSFNKLDMGCASHSCITDVQGRFCWYPTMIDELTNLYLENITLGAHVDAPEELGLVSWRGNISNNKENMIKMDKYGVFHTFEFLDETGSANEGTSLRHIKLAIYGENRPVLTYEYDDFENGGYFPVGQYKAWREPFGSRIKACEFESFEVTESSPEKLVFMPKAKYIYRGRVVDGRTDYPISGAFIMNLIGNDLAAITADEWKQMHDLPLEPMIDCEPLKPLHKVLIKNLQNLVRTNAEGVFEIKLDTEPEDVRLTAFDENFLSTTINTGNQQIDANGIVHLPDMPLYPAAKVVIEPYVDSEQFKQRKNYEFQIQIVFEPACKDCPPWVIKHYADDEGLFQPGSELDSNDLSGADTASEDIFNPVKMFFYVLYEFINMDRFTFFGLPLYFHRNYTTLDSMEESEFDPNDIEYWIEDSDINIESDEKYTFIKAYNGLDDIYICCQSLRIINAKQAYYVPAEFVFTMRFRMKENIEWCIPEIPGIYNLKQGETLDIGKYIIEKGNILIVKVVDSKGNLVPGITIDNSPEKIEMGSTCITNEFGEAWFVVCPYSKGRISPAFYDVMNAYSSSDKNPDLPYIINYEVGGEAVSGKEFTLVLPDEILKRLK